MKLQLAHFNSLISLVTYFNNDKRCRDFITEQRWGGDVVCPFCGCTHTYVCSNGDNQFKCADCKKRFSCLVGTICHNTKLPLQKWFMAMYLISSHKKGISSHQLSRDIDVTQKTAWFILHKVRTLFAQYDTPALGSQTFYTNNGKTEHKSIVTLQAPSGQVCHIAEDDHCYVLYNGSGIHYDGDGLKDKNCEMIHYIFPEAFKALKELPLL